jgi:hypothetical protein
MKRHVCSCIVYKSEILKDSHNDCLLGCPRDNDRKHISDNSSLKSSGSDRITLKWNIKKSLRGGNF